MGNLCVSAWYSEKHSSVRGHDRIKESTLILITSGGHFNIFFINFLRIPYIESVYLGHMDHLLQPSSLPISTLSHALPDPPLKPLPFQTLFSFFFLLYDPLSLICAVRMYFVTGPSTEIGGFIRGHIFKENWLSLPWQPPAQLGWELVHPPDPCWSGDWPGEVIFKIFIFFLLQALRCAPMGAAAVSGWGIFPSSVTVPSFLPSFFPCLLPLDIHPAFCSTDQLCSEHQVNGARTPAWSSMIDTRKSRTNGYRLILLHTTRSTLSVSIEHYFNLIS